MDIYDISLRRTHLNNRKAILVGLALALMLSVLAACILLGGPLGQGNRTFDSPRAVDSLALGRLSTLPVQLRANIISTMHSSPDGSYFVTQKNLADYTNISVKNKAGSVVVDDLVARNATAIGMNKRFRCQCTVSFAGWTGPTNFVIQISNAVGEQFEFIVDAHTGVVDEITFKRVK